MAPTLTGDQVASAQSAGNYAIKPENTEPKLDTSQWPLLLKNYNKLLVRSSHFTPIPSGCSPLKRNIASYIKFAFVFTFFETLLTPCILVDLALLIWINPPTRLRTKLSPG
jgi:DKCLD (NUC011) domain